MGAAAGNAKALAGTAKRLLAGVGLLIRLTVVGIL
jgi:hypothetical protein